MGRNFGLTRRQDSTGDEHPAGALGPDTRANSNIVFLPDYPRAQMPEEPFSPEDREFAATFFFGLVMVCPAILVVALVDLYLLFLS